MKIHRFVHALLFSAGLSMTPLALSTADEMTLNFVNADIESVVKAISLMTGKNFLVDSKVKGSINIVSGKPVSRALAYQVLVSALRMQGFAVVESPTVTKVLPEGEVKNQITPLQTGKARGGEQIVTQVFQIRYESAPQLLNAVKPLLSPIHAVTSYANSNSLVVTDSADSLRRLEKIIASIDVPHGEDPQVITLKHAIAADVAGSLNRLFSALPGAQVGSVQGQRSFIAIPEHRSNRVLLRTDDSALLTRARAIIQDLDQPLTLAGNIHVVPLKFADAARVAQTLRVLLGGSPSPVQETSERRTPPPPSTTGINSNNSEPDFQSAASGTSTAGALQSGSVIQADTATNSLIVVAPESVYRNLRNVIDMLDKRRAQVYIEALVVELTSDKGAEFGIQWQDLAGLAGNTAKVIGGTNFGAINATGNIIGAAKNIGTVGGGMNIGIVKGTVNIPGFGTVSNLGLLARFLETENKANILSTPNILTLDNEEAKIVIGQNLPFITGSYSNSGNNNTVTPFQTYERKDVGLTLKVKPQITEGGVVRIQIYQEASSVQSVSNTAGPITNKRSLDTHVMVDDGNIIALGGLIEDSMGDGEEKVPFLGDAPLIGGLFRYEKKSRKKTNLMVFLRPQIVREPADYEERTRLLYEKTAGQQQHFDQQRRSWMTEKDAPLLPSLKLSPPPHEKAEVTR